MIAVSAEISLSPHAYSPVPMALRSSVPGGKIDVLMNNAGVMAIPERQDQFQQKPRLGHSECSAVTSLLLHASSMPRSAWEAPCVQDVILAACELSPSVRCR